MVRIDEWSGFSVSRNFNGAVSYDDNNDTYNYTYDGSDNSEWVTYTLWISPSFAVNTTQKYYMKASFDNLKEVVGIYGDNIDPTPYDPGKNRGNGAKSWMYFNNVDRGGNNKFSFKKRLNSQSAYVDSSIGWLGYNRNTNEDTVELTVSPSEKTVVFNSCRLGESYETPNCDNAEQVRGVSGALSDSDISLFDDADMLGIYIRDVRGLDGDNNVEIRDLVFEGYIREASDIMFSDLNNNVVVGATYSDVIRVQAPKYYFFTTTEPGYEGKYYFKTVSNLSDSSITNKNDINLNSVGTYKTTYSFKDVDAPLAATNTADLRVIEKLKVTDVDVDLSVVPKTAADLFNAFYVSGQRTEDLTNLTVDDIEFTSYGGYDFDNPKIGTYDVTYKVTYGSGQEFNYSSKLTVKNKELTSAKLEATDIEVLQENAPRIASEVIDSVSARAYENDGSDLTNQIVILDYGTYNLNTPTVGTHVITLQVTGKDGNVVTTTVNIVVVSNDNGPLDEIVLNASNPVYVKTNSGETIEQVIDSYVLPVVEETVAGVMNQGYIVKSSDLNIISNGGYDNAVSRDYYIVIEALGTTTGLRSEKVIKVVVSEKIPVVPVSVDIIGQDLTIALGSTYNDTLAVGLHADTSKYNVVTAEVKKGTATTKVSLNSSNVVASDVDTSEAGSYQTVFYYLDDQSRVSLSKAYNVTVSASSAKALLSATDTEVSLDNAPKSYEAIKSLLNVNAVEVDGSDLTSSVKVVDANNYNLTSPKVGAYTVTLSVTGSDGITVFTTATLRVKKIKRH